MFENGKLRSKESMPLTYKHNSLEYEAGVEEKIPHWREWFVMSVF